MKELNKAPIPTYESAEVNRLPVFLEQGPSIEINPIDQEIAAIFDQASVDFIQTTLYGYWDKEIIDSFGLLEQINLFLTLAGRDKIRIPAQLQKAVKKVNEILPKDKLDTRYLSSLGVVKRNRLIQIISSVIMLIAFSFSSLRNVTVASSENESKNRIESPADFIDEQKIKELEAKAAFDRLFSEDLETVVAEMGWEDFLEEYDRLNDERVWSAEEVFQLILTQQPRYWGYYVVQYPQVFIDPIAKSNITLSEFMSSCGSAEFFRNMSSQYNNEFNWLDLWSIEELFTTLKMVDPDWGTTVVNNQILFAGHLTEEDLLFIINSTEVGGTLLDRLLSEYDRGWAQSWSKRELLDAIKLQMPAWKSYVIVNMYFFAQELQANELSAIVEQIAFMSEKGDLYPSQELVYIFDNYYEFKLYEIISPQEFTELIEKNFSEDVARQILFDRPVLSDLENRTIEELFTTKAISYVLTNHSEWETIYPIEDLLKFLRETNNFDYYLMIAPYPQPFQEAILSDEEIAILAYSEANRSYNPNFQFLLNFKGEFGWQNQVSIEKLVAVGRKDNLSAMTSAAVIFPELFLPHFTDEDFLHLIYNQSSELKRMDVLNSTNPIWQLFTSAERRRSLFELGKSNEHIDWNGFITYEDYFFEDILTFDELQKIINERDYSNSLRKRDLWKDNVSLEWEYNFFKKLDEETFAFIMASNAAEFSDFLTEDDILIILKHEPNLVLRNYRVWQNRLSPEFILEVLQNGQERDDYGYLVMDKKKIFAHLFYGQYDLESVIVHGGADILFDKNYRNDQRYYDEWSELISIEELFYILKGFDKGRVRILLNPNLFFEFVDVSELDLFVQSGSNALYSLLDTEEWTYLWTYEEIYESAKKHKTEGAARVLLSSQYKDFFMPFVQHGDLDFLIGSYSFDYGSSYEFKNNVPAFLEKWTTSDILESLKRQHPDSWGEFIADSYVYFERFVSKEDLEELVTYGARPHALAETGLWRPEELLEVYQKLEPKTWGATVLSNPDVFKELVISRNISLRQLLEAGGTDTAAGFTWAWEGDVWSRSEMLELFEEMDIELPRASG